MRKSKYDLITILGPTACGKTHFAACLSERTGGEIISADSRQVYKRMNLGTGKDYNDYRVNGKIIPCHLIDILEPGERYNVFEYQKDFLTTFNEIRKRGNLPVLCGGTGMYIDAVTRRYKLLPVPPDKMLRKELESKSLDELARILQQYKKLHNKTDIDTKKRAIRAIEIEEFHLHRPEINSVFPKLANIFIGIKYKREIIRKRITERLHARLKSGMIDEVEALLSEGLKPEELIYYGLEYKYITLYLTKEIEYDEMVIRLNIAIHQFAKRQMTWFRKMEKEGSEIYWLDETLPFEERLQTAVRLAGY
ncbi:MAG TPA: tRNA (adenosine(37)-N6)-dimethylallyltransferase MiaA [Bacteroidales bacterium]|nr:tRNA (adenosine(37)-N6)-dimethylallyltransferase MiaA [Bacteroidales bacterium]